MDKLPNIKSLIDQEVNEILTHEDHPSNTGDGIFPPDDHLANLYLIALKTAFFKMMRVSSAKEAVDLFAYSSRTVSDIRRVLSLPGSSPFLMQIVVREWVDIPLSGEFRGFVANGNLNALSQYYSDCYFRELAENPEPTIQRMVEFFNTTIKPLAIPYDRYIMDFAVTPEKVWVVEINPFGENTGCALFNWKADAEVLENGPFTYRVAQETSSPQARLSVWSSLLPTPTPSDPNSQKSGTCIIS